MPDVLLNTRTEMSGVEPMHVNGFAQTLEPLRVDLNRSRRGARIIAPLNDQDGSLDAIGVSDR